VEVSFQACDETTCLPPMLVSLELPVRQVDHVDHE